MFMENDTRFEAKLFRGSFDDGPNPSTPPQLEPRQPANARAFATVVVHEAFRLESGAPTQARIPNELDSVFATHITNGTSVTLSGLVEGSPRNGMVREVRLDVGTRAVELVARSARAWVRVNGRLMASAPVPFEPFEMSWAEAFGGAVHIPAGQDPMSKLPCPAMTSPHVYNPRGRGYLLSDRSADGVELPRIELLGDQLQTPTGQPLPGGLAPCPDLASMRWRNRFDARTEFSRDAHRSPFVVAHAAPLYCIFDDLTPGTRMAWCGLVATTTALAIPTPRSTVRWDTSETAHVGRRVRAVHVDLAQGHVHMLVQHAVLMPRLIPPRTAILSEVLS